jgi:hypothetical protein
MYIAVALAGLLALAGPEAGFGGQLDKVDRTIQKEPIYRGKPKYCLLVLGPEARYRVWLVLDGDVLYVDRNGNSDLTEPGERFERTAQANNGIRFNVGDITAGNCVYRNLRIGRLKEFAATDAELKLLAANPDASSYSLAVDVPIGSWKDSHNRSLASLCHFAGATDANGVLQFADCPADAPIIHFGGPWVIWPAPGQKLVRGRPEQFTAMIGTPGKGPGTLAIIQYQTIGHNPALVIPNQAHPVLDVKFPSQGGQGVAQRYILEDRC